jgi:hypothetical protein
LEKKVGHAQSRGAVHWRDVLGRDVEACVQVGVLLLHPLGDEQDDNGVLGGIPVRVGCPLGVLEHRFHHRLLGVRDRLVLGDSDVRPGQLVELRRAAHAVGVHGAQSHFVQVVPIGHVLHHRVLERVGDAGHAVQPNHPAVTEGDGRVPVGRGEQIVVEGPPERA